MAFQDSEAFDSGLLGEVINLFRYEGVSYHRNKLTFPAHGWTGSHSLFFLELRRLLNYFMKDCPEAPSVAYMVLNLTSNRRVRLLRKSFKRLWQAVRLLCCWVPVLLHYS